ncbi:hypothetical protein [Streptomyces acidicola]|uniref:hypothetical protein n=1 Tax=Streptomyces acidicola TaxID=2596892 RepID=UPI00342B449C
MSPHRSTTPLRTAVVGTGGIARSSHLPAPDAAPSTTEIRQKRPKPPAEFQRAAADLVSPLVDAWERRRRDGAQAATSATAARLAALPDKDDRHLTEAQVAATGPTARGRFGMCGRLDVGPGI